MPEFLLVMTLITNVILITIAIRAASLARHIRSRFAQLQATMIVLLCCAGVVASIQDIGFQLTQLGWLSESLGQQFVGRIQAVLVVGGLAVVVPVLVILRKLTEEFARVETVNNALVSRLPQGLTIETAGLTRRETEVVGAIAAGRVSDSEIAEQLFVSDSTAATHVRNIMKKTGVKRRADLALLSIETE